VKIKTPQYNLKITVAQLDCRDDVLTLTSTSMFNLVSEVYFCLKQLQS